jgi:hypothetical protein
MGTLRTELSFSGKCDSCSEKLGRVANDVTITRHTINTDEESLADKVTQSAHWDKILCDKCKDMLLRKIQNGLVVTKADYAIGKDAVEIGKDVNINTTKR